MPTEPTNHNEGALDKESDRSLTAASDVMDAACIGKVSPALTMLRHRDFETIRTSLAADTKLSTSHALVVKADSIVALRKIPSASVSLVLTDPPYHATKKENIYGDTAFAKDEHYLSWLKEYATEWRRILRSNGSLFCFCDSSLAARLEVLLSVNFNVLSHVVWTKPNDPGFDGWKGKMNKEALRQWYPHSERILFAEPAIEGNLHRAPFGAFLRKMRKQACLSGHQLTAAIGAFGKVNHGGAVSNWEAGRNTPSAEQYSKICSALIETGKIDSMPPYEDVVRPFFMDGKKEFTDVWNFPSVRQYDGKHPAEKPSDLLKHAIAATTFEGDVVLDCFAGSGSAALATIQLNRRAVAIEIEAVWVDRICTRVESCFPEAAGTIRSSQVRARRPSKKRKHVSTQTVSIFAGI